MPAAVPRRRWLTPDAVAGAAVALALVLIAMFASGGTNLATNTWVEVALLVVGAGAAVAVVIAGAGGRAWGVGTLLLFAMLAALTYASIGWSVQPANSWVEASRTLSYLAAFGTALVAARIAPSRWRAPIWGIAAAATVVCGYALLAKVFPATFDPNDTLGRLWLPLQYWNAVGLMAALGIPASVWAGTQREHAPVLRALSVPSISILFAALLMTYSRGSLAVAVIGTAFWFAFVPLRLRGALVLALGVAGGAAIAGWALATHGISADSVALAARTSAGHAFGVVLIVVLALATVAGLAAAFAVDRIALGNMWRRRIGAVLVGSVALVPVAGLAALAASSRGFTGEVSHIWSSLTNTNGVVGDRPGRLVDLSNSRPHYWKEAFKIGERHLLAGTGAGGFATAQSGYTTPAYSGFHAHVQSAHGYLFQTFSDFGVVGVVLSLALLIVWAAASRRPLGLMWPQRDPQIPRAPPGSPERIGMLTLFAIALTFGIHSFIDWTWFIPGAAIPGLIAAGWLAGRGPLAAPVGRLPQRRQLSRTPAATVAIAAIVLIALVAAWVTVQPLRSFDADNAAVAAAIRGDGAGALTKARAAAADDPVSIDPLVLLSRIYTQLGDQGAARRELVKATTVQPSNPAVWENLGCYDLGRHLASSAPEFRRALALEPGQAQLRTDPTGFCVSITG